MAGASDADQRDTQPTSPEVLSVSDLNEQIASFIEQSSELQGVRCIGEITDLHQNSTVLYLTLTDSDAELPCMIWANRYRKMDADLEDGTEVILEGDLVGLGDEPDAVVIPVEQDFGGVGRVHRGVVQSGSHRAPEREACLLPISEVVGSLRVYLTGEFEPDLGRVAEVRAVDRLVLDCAVLNNVDQLVDVLMVFRVNFGIEQRGDWGDRGLEDVEKLVEGEAELVGMVGGELIVQRHPLQRGWRGRDEYEKRCVDTVEQLSGLLSFEVGCVTADQRVDVGRQNRRRLYRRGEDDFDVNAGREMALQERPEPVATTG
ncbi:exodeoxyribonuclease VII large subunit [Haloglomus irregulare]|uniref:exodeoxyribonuclease VII large subunit n=1 Tax=Haloglomus irregulare TaxID=2234134 RepID=UPI00163DC36A|nr:exodeoxyribonuclease VII large subunit [Haloglomus irregulare]